ncbi:MAG: response regulator [Firmicutes bacterium]|nr:response regulator [Bacillota bacterium]MCL5039792.1 response regulator [Bacillota bacterium]
MNRLILVAEDNDINRILMEDILRHLQCDICHAVNGQEAIDLARLRRPALILMDLQLPGVDGISATRTLKQDPETREIPILAVSSYAFERERNLFLQAGGDDYISKPFDIDDLLQRVEGFLEGDGKDEQKG